MVVALPLVPALAGPRNWLIYLSGSTLAPMVLSNLGGHGTLPHCFAFIHTSQMPTYKEGQASQNCCGGLGPSAAPFPRPGGGF